MDVSAYIERQANEKHLERLQEAMTKASIAQKMKTLDKLTHGAYFTSQALLVGWMRVVDGWVLLRQGVKVQDLDKY